VILNIIDKRTRPYRWKQITAIVEPTYHDNSVHDSDQTDVPEHSFATYDTKEETSLAEAVAWANALPYAATLYFYDSGDGIKLAGRIALSNRESGPKG
jgi:hypothetical protein